MADKKYDVGILGYWYATNYGSAITYYALYKAIEKNKQVPVLIDRPEKEKDAEGLDVFPRRFLNSHCNISESVKWEDIDKLNNICETFVIGSDQVWTRDAIRITRYLFFLNFVNNNKREIAYAPSFGQDRFEVTAEEHALVSKYLSKFDAISVREQSGKDILKNQFGIEAQHILDPVFLIDIKDYDKLAEESKVDTSEDFALAYILDPTPDKEEFIRKSAEKLGLKVKIILDGRKGTYDRNRAKFAYFNDEHILPNMEVVDWVKYFKDAKYVLTDSHHGMAMAIIYNKQFIVYANRGRGYTRFTSLLNLLGMADRMIDNSNQVDESLIFSDIDYNKVISKLNQERDTAHKWLTKALKCKIKDKSKISFKPDKSTERPLSQFEILESNHEFKKIRLLATLIRDYEVKHVVLSPGGRDVPLIRMFEHNEDQFILHRVTDERSAAYFGLGLASQLRKPVACVCTSGTAASNYLPAVTEAYYTGVPLIMITADRRGYYLNQGEDQTIPQKGIYHNVVKKEFSIPEAWDKGTEIQCRREISDCILETTHHTFGPVHINITIDNIGIGANVPREGWKLLPFIYPHILRVDFNDGASKMLAWVDALKKSQRILLVYGQNYQPNEKQLRNIEAFAKKYNCVIVTDHISNLKCGYSLAPFVMLNSISQDEFNRELSPDILITVGGKRLMNDPLTFKVRGGYGNIRHWSVSPNGQVKDFYFRLSSVIECSQDYFFEWFAEKAGDISNNGVYFGKWKALIDKFSAPAITNFNAHYIQSKFLPAIPKNSFLHLGVGQSFYDCRRHNIEKSVEVYCNMGTNGIDGCTSTFMGQCAVIKDRLCFLLVGDLSFFYDMNAIWNKKLSSNMRILLVNNNGSGLLRGHNLKAVTSEHNTSAEGWVKSTGFEYISAHNKEEFEEKLKYFLSNKPERALFFEVFCQ